MKRFLFPDEVFCFILTFLPHPYRKPSHFLATKQDTIFSCFQIKTKFYYSHHLDNEWGEFNNFFAYKNWFISKRNKILAKIERI